MLPNYHFTFNLPLEKASGKRILLFFLSDAVINLNNGNMEKQKLVVISTIGNENPEKATLTFVLATACQSLDTDVVMFLQSSAVVLAKKGEADNIRAEGLAPLKDLLDTFMEMEGSLYLCSPCIKERGISMDNVVEGAEVAAAGTLASEVLGAKSVITY